MGVLPQSAADPPGSARDDSTALSVRPSGAVLDCDTSCGMRCSSALCCRCSSDRVTPLLAQEVAPAVRAETRAARRRRHRRAGPPGPATCRAPTSCCCEDGKPQRLTHFLFVGRATALRPADHGRAAAGPRAPRRPGAGAHHRARRRRPAPRAEQPAVHEAGAAAVRGRDRPARRPRRADPDQLSRRSPALTTGPRGRWRTPSRRISRESSSAAARGSAMTPAQAELILRGDQTALRLAARA